MNDIISQPVQPFKPTFLYIKKHSVTGKLYFGKTTDKDPIKYPGSGTYWKNHIKKHGKHLVETIWFCLFYDRAECVKFSLNFSEQENIVLSDEWLNLIPENGLRGGGRPGKRGPLSKEEILRRRELRRIRGTDIVTEETRQKLSKAAKGKRTWIVGKHHTAETKEKQSKALIGRFVSEETRAKKSASLKGKKWSEEYRQKQIAYIKNRPILQCPHCTVSSKSKGNMTRFHFDNCKNKSID